MRLVEGIASPENLEKLPAIVTKLKVDKFWPAGGNLSAKIVFIFKGIKPRTRLSSEKAKESSAVYLLIRIVSLALLIAIIYATHGGNR